MNDCIIHRYEYNDIGIEGDVIVIDGTGMGWRRIKILLMMVFISFQCIDIGLCARLPYVWKIYIL